MAFRSPTQSSIGPTSYYPPNVNAPVPMNPNQQPADDAYAAASPTRSKRPRPLDMQGGDDSNTGAVASATTTGDSFIQDQEANDDGDDDDDDEGDGKKADKKAGRRKIKIEFIQDKSRRHITFSKRKAGIMKKAYELSTLTGTQVLLLVVSETGLVYTFTTAKLQPLVTQPEGKNLIQACLNAPHGQLPTVGPGQPMSRMNNNSNSSSRSNVPGGLSIGNNKEDDVDGEDDDEPGASVSTPTSAKPRTRRRTSSGAVTGGVQSATSNKASGASPTSPNQAAPPTPNLPMHQQAPQSAMSITSPSSSHAQQGPNYSQQGHPGVQGYSNPADGNAGYMQGGHAHSGHPQMMAGYHLPHGQQQHAQPQHWGATAQPVPQGAQYGRR